MKLKKLLKIITLAWLWIINLLKNHSSGCFFALIFLAFAGAILIYYFYVLNVVAPPIDQQVNIKTELYNKTIEQLKNRELNIQKGTPQNYSDIFR